MINGTRERGSSDSAESTFRCIDSVREKFNVRRDRKIVSGILRASAASGLDPDGRTTRLISGQSKFGRLESRDYNKDRDSRVRSRHRRASEDARTRFLVPPYAKQYFNFLFLLLVAKYQEDTWSFA